MWGLCDTCGTLSGSCSGSLHHKLATTQATFHLINAYCRTLQEQHEIYIHINHNMQ